MTEKLWKWGEEGRLPEGPAREPCSVLSDPCSFRCRWRPEGLTSGHRGHFKGQGAGQWSAHGAQARR